MSLEEKIRKIWRDPTFSGSYRGLKTFQIFLKTDKNINISEKELYKIMKNDPIYVMHMQPKKVQRRKYYLSNVGELVQSDLAHMYSFKGYRYFIVFIDCYSFKLYLQALKNKKSVSVFESFKTYLQNNDIEKLETDLGTEYSLCKKYCKQNSILYNFKKGQNKANFAEYAILQVKRRLYTMLRGTLSDDWPSYLPIIQSDFNKTPMKRLGFFAPKDINDIVDTYLVEQEKKRLNLTEDQIPTFQEQNRNQKNYDKNTHNLNVGDYVYLNVKKETFTKSFDVQVFFFNWFEYTETIANSDKNNSTLESGKFSHAFFFFVTSPCSLSLNLNQLKKCLLTERSNFSNQWCRLL